ncbi:hypothetical protein TWF481_012209 [Arthrobotrys musiformis]|uniref:Uncharacterized protein n=1 Tax=Arthrobotrys musiformis TaxID=47236 RepID=A0AAV9VXF7_9PEZI
MRLHLASSAVCSFTSGLLCLNILTGISAEIIGTANTNLLSNLYKLNPENIDSIGYNLTTLIRWVTTTRPLNLPGQPNLNPSGGFPAITLTRLIGRIYIKIRTLTTDLKNPGTLWEDEQKLRDYGLDQQSVLILSTTALEFFTDRIAIAESFLSDLKAILFWDVFISPDFYTFDGPRSRKEKEVLKVWSVIYDMVAYIVTSRSGGIQISKLAGLVAYIMNIDQVEASESTVHRFSFSPEDVLALETGFHDIAVAIDLFISDRDWDSIYTSYKRLRAEFTTDTPFWEKIDQEQEVLRRFIYDYMMVFWKLGRRFHVLGDDIHTWAQEFKNEIEWTDTNDPQLGSQILPLGVTAPAGSS